jgi:hypothetical protein
MEDEDQVNVTIVMNKDIWPDIVPIRDDHGVHTAELMPMQLKNAQI